MGVHLPGAAAALFRSAATRRIERVWTADKRQACNSPFCMSDFDKFVCLRKLEVIKAEQERLLNIFRKTRMLFLVLLDYFVGVVVVLDDFFSWKKNGFLFSPLFLLIQAFRKPEIEIGLY